MEAVVDLVAAVALAAAVLLPSQQHWQLEPGKYWQGWLAALAGCAAQHLTFAAVPVLAAAVSMVAGRAAADLAAAAPPADLAPSFSCTPV
jgi:hypothetical protein